MRFSSSMQSITAHVLCLNSYNLEFYNDRYVTKLAIYNYIEMYSFITNIIKMIS